jgi:hypothetical protein
MKVDGELNESGKRDKRSQDPLASTVPPGLQISIHAI